MKPKSKKPLCVVIPFRFGNQDLPNKNIIEIHNKLLFQRSLNHALSLKSFINLHICLSTNRPEIIFELKDLSEKFGWLNLPIVKKNKLIFNDSGIDLHVRSHKLSSKKSPVSDTVSHIRQCYLDQKIEFQNWLLFQPTSPFRSTEDIKIIVKYLKNNAAKEKSLISVTNVGGSHPARMYSQKNGKLYSLSKIDKESRNRRQDLDNIYIRDGGFYLFSDSLAEQKKIFSINPDFFVRKYPWNINIDTRYDLAAALSIEEFEVRNDPNNSMQNKIN